MAGGKRGGTIEVNVNGVLQEAKGSWTYNLGIPVKEAIMGASAPTGYKETPQVAYLEGAITDRQDLDVRTLQTITGATVALRLANGKTVMFRNAYYASEGNITTEEGEIAVRFNADSAEEIT